MPRIGGRRCAGRIEVAIGCGRRVHTQADERKTRVGDQTGHGQSEIERTKDKRSVWHAIARQPLPSSSSDSTRGGVTLMLLIDVVSAMVAFVAKLFMADGQDWV